MTKTIVTVMTTVCCRSFWFLITESEQKYAQVCEAILNHLCTIEHWMIDCHISTEYSSVVEYIRGTNMDMDGTWGTDIEIL